MRPATDSRIAPADSARTPAFKVVPDCAAAHVLLLDWLRSLPAELGRQGAVLVPAERVAHAIRRRVCVTEGHPEWLAGIRLIPAPALARDILTRAGTPALAGGNVVRRLRILDLFRRGTLALRYFRTEQLRSGRGYGDAFARAIDDLETSGISATDLADVATELDDTDALAANRLGDVARVWRAAAAPASAHLTDAQVLQRATASLTGAPELAASIGPVAALLVGGPSGSLLRFLASLPEALVLFLDALPLRTGTQRWRIAPPASAGSGLPARPDPTAAGTAPSSELALLKRFLFTPPEQLADPARPRSTGPDGSVDLEQHPGIEDEIDAAALWVAEQVSDGVPVEEIGLIVPDTEPYAQLLIDRLSRIGGGALTADGEVAAYVAGGVALTTTPAGVRLLALLRAWQRSLNAEAVLRILPALRREGEAEAGSRLTPSRAAELVYGAGIVGGSPGDPTGAREWLPRLERRRRTLEQVVADADTVAADEPEKQRHRWDRKNAQEWLDDLVPLLPAIEALQQVADLVIAEAPLATLWEAVQAFVRCAYHVPPDPPNLLARLAEALEPVVAESAGVKLTGAAALDVLVDTLRRERRAVGRFGEPRIFIGTPAAAAGIELTVVRVLGLAEGALPRTPHDDPIVPSTLRSVLEDRLRSRIPALAVPRLEDSVLDDLHAFYRVVADTGERLALSAPRQWTERSEREVSGIMLEVAAALARPVQSNQAGQGGELPAGRRASPLPGIATRLRGGYFAPGRARRERFASTSLALARTTYLLLPHRHEGALAVPPQWLEPAVLAVDRVRVLAGLLESSDMTAIDGVIGAGLPAETIPGLSPGRPLSATALTTLLKCPQWFLYRYVLSMKEPTRQPATDTLDPLPYGQLFHTAAEAFFRADGETFCRTEGTVEEWVDRATAAAAAQFDARREEYSLRGVDAIARERLRLRNQIEQLVRYEWNIRSRTFVDTERPFGEPDALALRVGERTLFVAGKIDRVDRSGPHLSVRDLKTGRVRDLIEEPINPGRDLQIGLYALVLEHEMGPEAQVAHAAYVHPSAAGLPERAFRRSQMETLRAQTRRWLEIAADLLYDGAFVRTPVASDCDYCPYRPACGDGAQARSALKLAGAGVPAAALAFVRLKSEPVNE